MRLSSAKPRLSSQENIPPPSESGILITFSSAGRVLAGFFAGKCVQLTDSIQLAPEALLQKSRKVGVCSSGLRFFARVHRGKAASAKVEPHVRRSPKTWLCNRFVLLKIATLTEEKICDCGLGQSAGRNFPDGPRTDFRLDSCQCPRPTIYHTDPTLIDPSPARDPQRERSWRLNHPRQRSCEHFEGQRRSLANIICAPSLYLDGAARRFTSI